MRVRRRCHLFCSRKIDFRINPVSHLPCLNLLASDFIVDSEIKKKARYGLEPCGCSVKQRGPVSAENDPVLADDSELTEDRSQAMRQRASACKKVTLIKLHVDGL